MLPGRATILLGYATRLRKNLYSSINIRRLSAVLTRAPMLVLIAAAIMTAVIGCATPGEPTPRHPVVPQTVQNLTARQQGDAVVLDFALPVNSTEREPLPATPTIEIYRAVFA